MTPPTKLLLFDIDGTLVKAPSGQVMVQVIAEQLGRPVQNFRELYMGGTDLTLVPQLLDKNNIEVEDVKTFTKTALDLYDQRIGPALNMEGIVQLLPGTKALIQTLIEQPQFALGLVTGNTKAGAYAKLAPHRLDGYFAFGAFGDDDGNRDLLPPLAVERASAHLSTTFAAEHTWIIGDTLKDIRCAKANNLRCLAVASGWTDAQTLADHQPDVVVDDLSDAEKILQILNQ